MLLSLVLDKLRNELSDPDGDDWSDTELSSILSDQQLIMVRRQVTIDENYHNHRFTLLGANATQVSGDVYRYRLPRWCMRIVDMRLAQTGVTDSRKRELKPIDKYSGGYGWMFWGAHSIEVRGYASAEDIEVFCAKRPARLTKGTLPDQAGLSGSNQLRLDRDGSADALIHPHETEADSYVNGIFQITGVDVPASHIVSGQLAVCTASVHNQNTGGVLYTVLTLDRDWSVAPTTADTYEMHVEVGDEHMRLLVLLAARAAWIRKGNLDEVRASEGEVAQEWREFISHIQPRQLQMPHIIKSSLYPTVPTKTDTYDDDTSWYWG